MIEIQPLCQATDLIAVREENKLRNFSLWMIVAAIHHGATSLEFLRIGDASQICEWVDGERCLWPDPPPGVWEEMLQFQRDYFGLTDGDVVVDVQLASEVVQFAFRFPAKNHLQIELLNCGRLRGRCKREMDAIFGVIPRGEEPDFMESVTRLARRLWRLAGGAMSSFR